ncbi:MAG: acyltransferase domain-containing protein [Desulfovibrio sp.]|nr:acyltransferase domain-containing protein [Desulfovibrio sp.]
MPQQSPQDDFTQQENLPEECALDGVRYALLPHAGRSWRVGSLTPAWRQELLGLPREPDGAALEQLGERNVWLGAEDAPALAVMCCGLGSAWPGMGRELYDVFPVARAAMDRIAVLADWDVLGLMDEKDPEVINHTRWQCPYLFLLEWAQWSVLRSLGLHPDLICGHSLGELIGLCLADIYTPEAAWRILDTRAAHMAELEAEATRETGMMAVHAQEAVIRDVCATWSGLCVSNYNTPSQYILSGPREALLEARKSLRKRRIPAMVLNVNMAFHHPGMRVLRDMSIRRLNGMAMRPPHIPMLRCISADFYPRDKSKICRCIADLDENAVRWTDCVRAMTQREGIKVFLELGPQDTLCNLVAENQAQALCLSAGRKNRETAGLRQTCARLFALGLLQSADIWRQKHTASQAKPTFPVAASPAPISCPLQPMGAPQRAVKQEAFPVHSGQSKASSWQECLSVVTAAIARASGRSFGELRPEMDLRYDLALRSSRFPLIVQDVEKALGISVQYERLLHVSTIGDLARVLTGQTQEDALPARETKSSPPDTTLTLPLMRYAPLATLPDTPTALKPLPLDVSSHGLALGQGDVLAVWATDGPVLLHLLRGLAPLGCVFALPADLVEKCAPLVDLGARLVPWPSSSADPASALKDILQAVRRAYGRLDGLFLVPPVDDPKLCPTKTPGMADALRGVLDAALPLRFVCCCSVLPPLAEHCVLDEPLAKALLTASARGLATKVVHLLHAEERPVQDEWGDMLARELLHAPEQGVIWTRPGTLGGSVNAPIPQPRDLRRVRPQCFPLVFMEPQPVHAPAATLVQTGCHFSRFADMALNEHGGCGNDQSLPWLPVCRMLEALQESAIQAVPWLRPTGFCDLHFHARPVLPPGVTRECRILTVAEPWLMQDGSMTRLCRGQLSVAKLTASGRHLDEHALVAEGMTWLAARETELPPVWTTMPEGALRTRTYTDSAPLYRIAGLGSAWHLAVGLADLGGDMYAAIVRLPETSIAPGGNYRYSPELLVVEAVLQAARLAMTYRESAGFTRTEFMASVLRQWRLSNMGFIRYTSPCPAGPLEALVCRSWADGRRLRFDAQVMDGHRHVLLTCHHVEFERCDPCQESLL